MSKKKNKAEIGITVFSSKLGEGYSLRTTKIEGELFLSSKDFLKYMLYLERTNHTLNTKNFVLNRLPNDFDLTTSDFWNNKENEPFFGTILNNVKENFTEWYACGIIRVAIMSDISDDLKIRMIDRLTAIDSYTHDVALKSERVSPNVKSKLLKFKTEPETIEGIVLNEKDVSLLRTAMYLLNVESITSPNVIDILIQETSLDIKKRIYLISRSSNLELLNKLIFNDDSIEIIRSARNRLKEMTPAEKFIMAS